MVCLLKYFVHNMRAFGKDVPFRRRIMVRNSFG
jgi:hypothetical protein